MERSARACKACLNSDFPHEPKSSRHEPWPLFPENQASENGQVTQEAFRFREAVAPDPSSSSWAEALKLSAGFGLYRMHSFSGAVFCKMGIFPAFLGL